MWQDQHRKADILQLDRYHIVEKTIYHFVLSFCQCWSAVFSPSFCFVSFRENDCFAKHKILRNGLLFHELTKILLPFCGIKFSWKPWPLPHHDRVVCVLCPPAQGKPMNISFEITCIVVYYTLYSQLMGGRGEG
jgi:hypothetical protein